MTGLAAQASEIQKFYFYWRIENWGIFGDPARPGDYTHDDRWIDFGSGGYSPDPPHSPQAVLDIVSAEAADVGDLFLPFTWMPAAGSFDSLAGSALDAMGAISTGGEAKSVSSGPVFANPAMDGVKQLSVLLQDWDGDAAEAFLSNYESHFDTVAKNQFLLLDFVHGCVTAEQAVWRETDRSINDIADKTVALLRSKGGEQPDRGGFALTVLAAVLTVAASVPGGPVVTAVTAAAEGAALAGALIEPAPSSSPVTVLDAMRSAVGRLKQNLHDVESEIDRAAAQVAGRVPTKPDNQFLLHPPALARHAGGLGADRG